MHTLFKPLFLGLLFGFTLFSAKSHGQLLVTSLADSGPGTLREAIANSNPGGTITFDPSLVYLKDTILLESTLTIYDGIKIIGPLSDSLFISGSDSIQILQIDAQTSTNRVIHLSNLHFISGYRDSQSGAAVKAYGTTPLDSVSLFRCTFKGNVQDSLMNTARVYGAAVAVYSNYVNINACAFISNRGYSAYGGAIYLRGLRSTIRNSRFIDNSVSYTGSAIRLAVSHFEIYNSFFLNNRVIQTPRTANNYGNGCIADAPTGSSTGTRKVINCTFKHNHAFQEGGAVYFRSPFVQISRSYFEGNTSDLRGGAIYAANEYTLIDHCTFYANSSSAGGGAIADGNTRFNIENSTFFKNVAVSGAAILFGGRPDTIASCTFVSNHSTSSVRGVVNNSSSGYWVTNSLFNQNSKDLGGPRINLLGYNRHQFSDAPFTSTTNDLLYSSGKTIPLDTINYPIEQFPHVLLPFPDHLYTDAGDPSIVEPAQNGPVFGIRDIGATDGAVIRYDTLQGCLPHDFFGMTVRSPGNYIDTTFGTSGSIDSISMLTLVPIDDDIFLVDSFLVVQEDHDSASYQWLNCVSQSLIPGEDSMAFKPEINGAYAAIITLGDCIDTTDCLIFNEVSVPDFEQTPLTFFPNPADEWIQFNHTDDKTICRIYSLSGQLVLRKAVPNSRRVNISSLSGGVYILMLSVNDRVIFTSKFSRHE